MFTDLYIIVCKFYHYVAGRFQPWSSSIEMKGGNRFAWNANSFETFLLRSPNDLKQLNTFQNFH